MNTGVLCEIGDRVARVTLDRPRSGNRITERMAAALVEACEEIEDRRPNVVVIRGKGKTFCAGLSDDLRDASIGGRLNFVEAVARLTMPVVAVIIGPAIGAGAELALAADLRVAAAGATIEFPDVGAGRLPRFGATQRLPRLIGRTRALEVLLFATAVSARDARALGLVTRVVPRGKVDSVVERLVQELCARGPLALAFAKEAVRRAGDLPLADGLRLEEDLYVLLQTTEDRAEGVRSFLEKRSPRFRGR